MTKQTDEERRAIAAKLRELADANRGLLGIERVQNVLYESQGILGTRGLESVAHVIERHADLIEPPFPPCEETEEWLDSIKREGQPKTVREVIEDIIWTCSTVDIGPNGNAFSGADEGIVSTDALISTWETQLADLIEPEPERTCRIKYAYAEGSAWPHAACSECGGSLSYYDTVNEEGEESVDTCPYCPHCGAKVVGE